MAEMGSTVLGAEKKVFMKQEAIVSGKGPTEMGKTILGTEKIVTMKQTVINGEAAGGGRELQQIGAEDIGSIKNL